MKKLVPILFTALILINTGSLAGSLNSPADQAVEPGQLSDKTGLDEPGVRKEYLAEQKVKLLPSKHGSTIDSYLTNMTRIPMAEDLGWKVYPVEDGFEVERSIQINNSKIIRYKWKVSDSGEVTPLDDGARSLMK